MNQPSRATEKQITFNSLFEIHHQYSARDVVIYAITFNSLFEIRDEDPQGTERCYECLSILFLRFTGKKWRRDGIEPSELSILFLRFRSVFRLSKP